MRYKFLLRVLILLVALAVALAVIVFGRGGFGGGAADVGQRTFFEQFVVTGGPIVWFVLLPMSVAAVYLVVEHSITIRRKRLVPEGIGRSVVQTMLMSGPQQFSAGSGEKDDFVSIAVAEAVNRGGGDWFRIRNTLF